MKRLCWILSCYSCFLQISLRLCRSVYSKKQSPYVCKSSVNTIGIENLPKGSHQVCRAPFFLLSVKVIPSKNTNKQFCWNHNPFNMVFAWMHGTTHSRDFHLESEKIEIFLTLTNSKVFITETATCRTSQLILIHRGLMQIVWQFEVLKCKEAPCERMWGIFKF